NLKKGAKPTNQFSYQCNGIILNIENSSLVHYPFDHDENLLDCKPDWTLDDPQLVTKSDSIIHVFKTQGKNPIQIVNSDFETQKISDSIIKELDFDKYFYVFEMKPKLKLIAKRNKSTFLLEAIT